MVSTFRRRLALVPVSLIWLGVIMIAVLVAWLKGLSLADIVPIAGFATIPALIALVLTPVIDREWAQFIIILGWLCLAVAGVLAVSFVPMAILFMCAPAAAALFERDRVVEAMVMAAILASLLFYAGQQGVIPETITGDDIRSWGQQLGIFATLSLLISTLMMSAQNGQAITQYEDAVTARTFPSVAQGYDLDYIPGSFFLIDRDNKVKALNAQARETFDLTEQDGAGFTAILGLDSTTSHSLNDLMTRARTVGEERAGQFLIDADENAPKYWRFVVNPQTDGYVGVSVQELDEAYREIRRLQRETESYKKLSEDKTLFFSGVSHELRTPLNAIIGFSDMMRSRLFGPLPSKYAEYADMIHDSGQHMLDLVGDVLDIGKLDAGKYELKYDHFNVPDILRSTLKMIRPAADQAEVILDMNMAQGDDLLIHADRRALRQILLNLVSNAIKYSSRGGKVDILAVARGDRLHLMVKDEGIGMDQALIDQVGEAYLQSDDSHTNNREGTGLGLRLVKSLVDLHGGDFTLESEIGKGTKAVVYLPLEGSAA